LRFSAGCSAIRNTRLQADRAWWVELSLCENNRS